MRTFPVKLDDMVERFPEWLEDALSERGLTQYALACRMGRGNYKTLDRVIYSYRRGTCLPKLDNLTRMMRAFEPRGVYLVTASQLKELFAAAAWAKEHGWNR